MKQMGGGEESGGILIRGAGGELWFMGSGDERPQRIEDEELEGQLTGFAERQPEGMMTFPLPENIKDRLEQALGQVLPFGVIIWWAHRLSK